MRNLNHSNRGGNWFTLSVFMALLMSTSICLNAQISDSLKWDTGFNYNIGNSGVPIHLISLNDSLLITKTWQKKLGNIDSDLIQIIKKNDLSVVNSFYTSGLEIFTSGNQLYFLTWPGIATTDSVLGLFTMNASFSGLDTVNFQISLPKDYYLLNSSSIIDSNLYLLWTDKQGYSSTHTHIIEKYDLTGNLLQSKLLCDSTMMVNSWSTGQRLVLNYFKIGPYQHPVNPNQLVLGSYINCRVAVLDKNTLDTVSIMPRYFNNPLPNSTYFDGGYALYPDRFVCAGSVYNVYNLTNPQLDWQYLLNTRGWNGDSIHEQRFGSYNEHEKCYSFTTQQNPSSVDYILGGSWPFNSSSFFATDYRTIKITRVNSASGLVDSIQFHGHKNHVPIKILADGDDLFVLSTFSNAWSDNKSFFQLDKIGNYLIGLFEEKQATVNVILYPNPAQTYLTIDVGNEKLKRVDFYNIQGQLVSSPCIDNDQNISISELANGRYVAFIEFEAGTYTSVIFIKND